MTVRIPRPLLADAYTLGSMHVSFNAYSRSVYHVVARKGLDSLYPSIVRDSRLIFTGLQDTIDKYIVPPVTKDEIEETENFCANFHAGNTRFRWNKGMWSSIVEKHGGIIPIQIEAFEEGSVFFPYEPVIQITGKEGFGELAAHFESKILQIWATIERTTMLKWWHEYLIQRSMKEDHLTYDEAYAATKFMFHDFGDRAGSCGEESEVLGMAHLLVGPGTDTTSAAYLDWVASGKKIPFGQSIHALAHRTVMGYPTEMEAHGALMGMHMGVSAHVVDTWDFKKSVTDLIKYVANNKHGNHVVVLRPDSGDPTECIKYILRECEIAGIFAIDKYSGNKIATRVRWIQGDSMTWDKMIEIMDAVSSMGWSNAKSGAFGIGGFLRNSISRDHTGLSMKLAEYGERGFKTAKKSENSAKSSIPGVVRVINNRHFDTPTVFPADDRYVGAAHAPENMLKVVYSPKGANEKVNRDVIRERIFNNFYDRYCPKTVLSREIINSRNAIFEEKEKNR